MSAEFKQIAKIEIVTDTETAMYKMGECSGGFNDEELEKYIISYGAEDLLMLMSRMQYQIWKAICARTIKKDMENISSFKSSESLTKLSNGKVV